MIPNMIIVEHSVPAIETGVLGDSVMTRRSVYIDELGIYVTIKNGMVTIETDKKHNHIVSRKLSEPPKFLQDLAGALDTVIMSKDRLATLLSH